MSIKLPVPMLELTPTISNNHLVIVGYCGVDRKAKKGVYKFPVANITASIDRQHNSSISSRWTELTAAVHSRTALVPGSSLSVIFGGWSHRDKTSTADIKMYDDSDHSWRSIGSLSSTKCLVGVAAVDNNAIVVIGGCTNGTSTAERKSFTLTVVELREAKLFH